MNDGAMLEQTIDDLAGLWPSCASLGIVPVGLTSHREGLDKLEAVDSDLAGQVIHIVHEAQRRLLDARGVRFVFAADEFYYLAGREIPAGDEYEGYPQLENGIGLARMFSDEFEEAEAGLPERAVAPISFTVVTGVLGARAISRACARLSRIGDVRVRVLPVANRFFGESVTVSGLVVGADIVDALKKAEGEFTGDFVAIPDVMLRRGQERFLDDMTPNDIEQATGIPVRIVNASARGLVECVI